ncbi:MAG: small basic family protein [Clostridiales bacterium]|nr:small basic family protein [Clostridiales bacterium]
MAIVMLIGLAAGIALGFVFNVTYPLEYSFYITMGLLAAMDSVVGALRSYLEGKYNNLIFVTGFLTNAALAGILTFVGDKLGVPLYYAAILVFGGRLFNNLAASRRIALDKFLDKKNKNMEEK